MPTSLPLLYFNKNFSVTSAQLHAVREGGRLRTLASHSDPTSAMLHAADRAIAEPRGLLGEAYVDWLLATVQREGVAALLVGKEAARVSARQADFAALGVQVIVAGTPGVLRELDHKDQFLRGWDEATLPIPAWTTFRSSAEFEAAMLLLKADPAYRPGTTRLCLKPARGIYAAGFRVLTEGRDLRSFLAGELYQMSVDEARRMFGGAEQEGRALPLMLLMHTLEGAERSVDCVAWQGELAAAVVRRKSPAGGGQYLEDRPDLVQAARQIARRYRLSGIFNVQTKDDLRRRDGEPRAHMLEINARASGGLRYSMAAGVNYAELAALLALGLTRPQDTPLPTTGLTVTEDKTVRIVGAAGLDLNAGLDPAPEPVDA